MTLRDNLEADARRKARVSELVDQLTRHGDCCEHPQWRHKFAAASTSWRVWLLGLAFSQGAVVVYALHPVVHMILRICGIGCP